MGDLDLRCKAFVCIKRIVGALIAMWATLVLYGRFLGVASDLLPEVSGSVVIVKILFEGLMAAA